MGQPQFEIIGTGIIPLIGHVPHCGTSIPEDIEQGLLLTGEQLSKEISRITDHHTDKLFEGVLDAGGMMFLNRFSRLVIDPERFRSDESEAMASRGAGAIYSLTSDLEPLRAPLSQDSREELLSTYYDPYARAMTALVHETLELHGSCTILDCHSFPVVPLGYALDRGRDRPEICIGTDPFHTSQDSVRVLAELCLQQGRHVLVDKPYSGSYVPERFFQKDHRVQSLMIEVRRDLYMDESTAEPSAGWDDTKALIDQMIQAIC